MQFKESKPVTLGDVKYIIEQLMLEHNVKKDNMYECNEQGQYI